MINQNHTTKSLVIQKYLNGKSMDQIVSETNVSKGKVHYIINDWKNGIGIPNIEDLRDFSVTSRKSGISIGQCAQGFRMVNTLKNFGIYENENDNDVKNNGGDNGDGSINEFSSFIEEVYKNCKRAGVPPSIIPMWIKDLFDFYSSSPNDTNESPFSLNGDNDADFDMDIDSDKYSSNSQPKSTAGRFDGSTHQQQQRKQQQDNPSFSPQEAGDIGDCDPNSSTYIKENSPHSKLKQNLFASTPNNEIEIPFVSQVSFYIDQKEKRVFESRKL